LERYELDVFAEEDTQAGAERAIAVGATEPTETDDRGVLKPGARAARRRLAAQSSLFELANQKVVDELRETEVDKLSDTDAKMLLRELREKLL
jgi:hypothetical protein